MKKNMWSIALAIAVLAVTVPLLAAESGWIVGTWEMVRDVDGSQKDWLEFTADGKAFNISPDGRRVPGQYVVTDSEVAITFSHKGLTIPITLTFTPDKTKLLARSKKTGNTSEYEKVK